METIDGGSIRLFRFKGIDVFLHWSWFLVAAIEIALRAKAYSSMTWNVLEYLALFLIVLLHEFGHSFACRQVGGKADRILLWPLGGLAYVQPPQRPGATLWSIAAGPLVNLVLLPIFFILLVMSVAFGWNHSFPNAHTFLVAITTIDLGLLIFNLLPIYPLDGGQIVRSLLWFWLGRAKSLLVASILGFLGVAALGFLALVDRSIWDGAICVFLLLYCGNGLRRARALSRVAKASRRDGFACPACKLAPPVGSFWRCHHCEKPFDAFREKAVCPTCGTRFGRTPCLECGALFPLSEWGTSSPDASDPTAPGTAAPSTPDLGTAASGGGS